MSISIIGSRSYALTALMLVFHSIANAQQCATPPSGQIYWLDADNNYDDRAGFYNGSIGGQVDFVPGKVGGGVRFDNDNDLIFPSVDVAEDVRTFPTSGAPCVQSMSFARSATATPSPARRLGRSSMPRRTDTGPTISSPRC